MNISLDAIPLPYLVLDDNDRLHACNQAWAETLGHNPINTFGKHIHNFIATQCHQSFNQALQECRSDGKTREIEVLFVRCSGTHLPSFTIMHFSKDDDSIHCIVHDATLYRNLESTLSQARIQARQELRTKALFLANVSHEIRTPLNAILGFASLLSTPETSTEQATYLAHLRSSCELLSSTMNDILELSSIESGRPELTITSIDLRSVLDSIAQVYLVQAKGKGLEFGVLVEASLPQVIRGDAQGIQKVLTSLLDNALKFTYHGGITLRVTTSLEGDSTGIKFEISDTGIGIPSEHHSRLFTPFTQVDSSLTRVFGGAGLGLALARNVVEMLGGEIGFTSQPQKGSTFWFTLPIESGPETRDNPTRDITIHGLTVLIIGPETWLSTVIFKHLVESGCIVKQASSLRESLAFLSAPLRSSDRISAIFIHKVNREETALAIMEELRMILPLPLPATVLYGLPGIVGTSSDVTHAGFGSCLRPPLTRPRITDVLREALSRGGSGLSDRQNQIARTTLRTPRILLAEDSTVNQMIVSLLLKKLDMSCDIASNGEEAVRAIEQHAYDLVIMDCQMPIMDGLEATRRIRQQCQSSIPIIALTASVLPADRQLCLSAGMNDFLTKPLQREHLERTLSRWLEHPLGTGQAPLNDSAKPHSLVDRVAQELGLTTEGVRALFQRFSCEFPVRYSALKRALTENDLPTAIREAHTLKGAAANIRLSEIAGVSSQIESLAKSGEMQKAATMLDSLTRCMQELERENIDQTKALTKNIDIRTASSQIPADEIKSAVDLFSLGDLRGLAIRARTWSSFPEQGRLLGERLAELAKSFDEKGIHCLLSDLCAKKGMPIHDPAYYPGR